jgi:tetratricopeptide (TPR) repeat protein
MDVSKRAVRLLTAAALTVWVGSAQASDRSTPPDPAAAAALRRDGLELGYNLDHADALAAFSRAIEADPTDPTAYRMAAAIAWIKLLFSQGSITVDDYLGQARANVSRPVPDPALDTQFRTSLQEAIRLGEEQVRARPLDAEAHFNVGAAYGFLASYTATVEGRLMGSFGPARRAYREHQRALALDPKRVEAGLTVGMYRYAVADLAAPLRLFAHLAGFGGDRALALRLIEDAAFKPSEVQANALFTLVLIYNREGRYDAAIHAIEELQQRFPRNRLLWLEAGHTWLRAGNPARARTALEEGLARLSKDSRPRALGEEARWRFAYGSALVALKDVEAAQRELNAALAGAQRDWVRGRIRKELGKVCDLRGDRACALGQYRAADALCRQDHDGDCVADARQLIKRRYQ